MNSTGLAAMGRAAPSIQCGRNRSYGLGCQSRELVHCHLHRNLASNARPCFTYSQFTGLIRSNYSAGYGAPDPGYRVSVASPLEASPFIPTVGLAYPLRKPFGFETGGIKLTSCLSNPPCTSEY